MIRDLPQGGKPTQTENASVAQSQWEALGGESHGLLLSELGLTDGVPWQHQLLNHGVHRTLHGKAVFLEEKKEGWFSI